MTDAFTSELKPEYRGRRYFIHGDPKSEGPQPDRFSVTIYYKDAASGEKIEVARVDTAHGYTHFDRLYRRDEPKEEVDWGFWEAVEKLIEDWRTYAENYDDAHG